MSENGKITWTNDKRLLSELIPWPRNPRQIKKEQVERLQESLDEFGQPETIAIGPGNEIYNGHQRLKSWADKFGDIEVDVRVSDRALTEKEREKLTIFLHKGAAGEWDFDTLANEFEVDDLLDWGFKGYELGMPEALINFDEEWEGMPEFDTDDLTPIRTIKVNFATQDDINSFAELVNQKITEKTRSIWFPEAEIKSWSDKVYKDES
jgi:hypothetical protein